MMATKSKNVSRATGAYEGTKDNTEQILWMADCYSLAKRFPNPHTWLSLLDPVELEDVESLVNSALKLSPFQYWLWMEIWKAAQSQPAATVETAGNAAS